MRPDLSPAIAGEASPYYLFHPLAAQRLARDFPDVHIIVSLRDPIDRAYSHYKEAVYHGRETLSFEGHSTPKMSGCAAKPSVSWPNPATLAPAHEHLSYLAQSRYLDMLPRWFSLFPREQFHIYGERGLLRRPRRHVNEVWRFLGLAPWQLMSRTRHNHQPAPDIRPETRQRLQKSLADHNQSLEELLGRRLPWPASQQPVR